MQINSIPELKTFAEQFLAQLSLDKKKATIVCLHGDLGAGKTTFVQQIAELLSVTETVISPTFLIWKSYPTAFQAPPLKGEENHLCHPEFNSGSVRPLHVQFKKLIHVDAYRLENGEKLKKLGFVEELKNPENLVFIEWAENIKDILPKDVITLKFEILDGEVREVEVG